MKILYLEDHTFFASEILEYLRDDLKYDVVHADGWDSVKKILDSGKTFDISILDVILKNGKTGVQVAETWENQLGRIVFITGCSDEATIKALDKYSSISKLTPVWVPLSDFISGGNPKIG